MVEVVMKGEEAGEEEGAVKEWGELDFAPR